MAKKTTKELKAALLKIYKQVQAEIDSVAVEMANNAKALSYRNITSKGIKGAAYSTNEYPAFFLMGKELNQKGRSFLKQKAKKKETTNWKELRGAQGLPTNFVDVQYSGKMWAGVVVVKIVKEGGKSVAILGGKTKVVQDKMNWNEDRYGKFIEDNLTASDKKFILSIAKKKIKNIFVENGILNK